MRATLLYTITASALVLSAVGASTALAAEAETQARASRAGADAKSIVANWPDSSKKAAQKMIEKYGQPDEVTDSRVIWLDNGPWKQTIVYREEIDHRFPMPHKDVLEQFIDYKVPPDKFDELAQYDGSVIAERTKGELSARCDKEEMNFLALNLADDIVQGKRTVNDARQFYAKTAMETKQGKMSPYVQKLRFSEQQRTADADQPSKIVTAMKEEESGGKR